MEVRSFVLSAAGSPSNWLVVFGPQMHDIPKSALRKAVAGPPAGLDPEERTANKKNKAYSRLLTADTEETEDDYAPPAEL